MRTFWRDVGAVGESQRNGVSTACRERTARATHRNAMRSPFGEKTRSDDAQKKRNKALQNDQNARSMVVEKCRNLMCPPTIGAGNALSRRRGGMDCSRVRRNRWSAMRSSRARWCKRGRCRGVYRDEHALCRMQRGFMFAVNSIVKWHQVKCPGGQTSETKTRQQEISQRD